MQCMKKSLQKLLAIVLAFAMVVGTLPVAATADDLRDNVSGVIVGFADLSTAVTQQFVPLGTQVSELNLPDTLWATVAFYVPAPKEDEIYETGDDAPETSDFDFSAFMAIPGAATLLASMTLDITDTLDVPAYVRYAQMAAEVPVTWASPNFDGETPGTYAFYAFVDGGLIVEAELPVILVTVVASAVTASGDSPSSFVIAGGGADEWSPAYHNHPFPFPYGLGFPRHNANSGFASNIQTIFNPALVSNEPGIISYTFSIKPLHATYASNIEFFFSPGANVNRNNSAFVFSMFTDAAAVRRGFRLNTTAGTNTAWAEIPGVNWNIGETYDINIIIDSTQAIRTVTVSVLQDGVVLGSLGPVATRNAGGNNTAAAPFDSTLGQIRTQWFIGDIVALIEYPHTLYVPTQQPPIDLTDYWLHSGSDNMLVYGTHHLGSYSGEVTIEFVLLPLARDDGSLFDAAIGWGRTGVQFPNLGNVWPNFNILFGARPNGYFGMFNGPQGAGAWTPVTANSIPYTPGTLYEVRIVADTVTQTFSGWVRELDAEGVPVGTGEWYLVGENYNFRNQSLNPDGINDIAAIYTGPGAYAGAYKVFNHTISAQETVTPPTITTVSLAGGFVGRSYSQTLAATGTAPITWSVVDGALPYGLALSEEGRISGTPTTVGEFTFTVRAYNGVNPYATREFTIVISPLPDQHPIRLPYIPQGDPDMDMLQLLQFAPINNNLFVPETPHSNRVIAYPFASGFTRGDNGHLTLTFDVTPHSGSIVGEITFGGYADRMDLAANRLIRIGLASNGSWTINGSSAGGALRYQAGSTYSVTVNVNLLGGTHGQYSVRVEGPGIDGYVVLANNVNFANNRVRYSIQSRAEFDIAAVSEANARPFLNLGTMGTVSTQGTFAVTNIQLDGSDLPLLFAPEYDFDNLPRTTRPAEAGSGGFTFHVGPNREFRKIQDVVALLRVGDTVLVDGDAVFPGPIYLDHRTAMGRPDAPITIKGVQGDYIMPAIVTFSTWDIITVRSDYVVIDGFIIRGNQQVLMPMFGFSTYEQLHNRTTFIQGASGMFNTFERRMTRTAILNHSQGLTIRNNNVSDCRRGVEGSDTGAGDILIEFNDFHHNGFRGGDHNIYIAHAQGFYPDSVAILRYNIIRNSIHGGNGFKTRMPARIYYNIFYNNAVQDLELNGPSHEWGHPNINRGLNEHGTAAWLPSYIAWKVNNGYLVLPDTLGQYSQFYVREDFDIVGNLFIDTRGANTGFVRAGGDGTGENYGRFRFVNNTFIILNHDRPTAVNSRFIRIEFGVESFEFWNNVFFTDIARGADQLVFEGTWVDQWAGVIPYWVNGRQIFGSNNAIFSPNSDDTFELPAVLADWENTYIFTGPEAANPFVAGDLTALRYSSRLTDLASFDFNLATPLAGVPIANTIHEWPEFDFVYMYDWRFDPPLTRDNAGQGHPNYNQIRQRVLTRVYMQDTAMPYDFALTTLDSQIVLRNNFPPARTERTDNGTVIGAFSDGPIERPCIWLPIDFTLRPTNDPDMDLHYLITYAPINNSVYVSPGTWGSPLITYPFANGATRGDKYGRFSITFDITPLTYVDGQVAFGGYAERMYWSAERLVTVGLRPGGYFTAMGPGNVHFYDVNNRVYYVPGKTYSFTVEFDLLAGPQGLFTVWVEGYGITGRQLVAANVTFRSLRTQFAALTPDEFVQATLPAAQRRNLINIGTMGVISNEGFFTVTDIMINGEELGLLLAPEYDFDNLPRMERPAEAGDGPFTFQVGPTREFRKPQDVIHMLRAGDTVEIDGDFAYPGPIFLEARATGFVPGTNEVTLMGTADAPITFRGIMGEYSMPIITSFNALALFEVIAPYVTIENFILRGNQQVLMQLFGFDSYDQLRQRLGASGAGNRFAVNRYGAFDVSTDNFRNRLVQRGIFQRSNGLVVRNVYLADNQHGIEGNDFTGGSITIEHSHIRHNGFRGMDHNIYVANGGGFFPDAIGILRYNIIRDSLHGGNGYKARIRTIIYNNIFYNNAVQDLELLGPEITADIVNRNRGLPVDPIIDLKIRHGYLDVCPSYSVYFGMHSVREDYDVVGNLFVNTRSSAAGFIRMGGDATNATSWGRNRVINNTFIFIDSRGNADTGTRAFRPEFGNESIEFYNNVFFADNNIRLENSGTPVFWVNGRQIFGSHNAIFAPTVFAVPAEFEYTHLVAGADFAAMGGNPFANVDLEALRCSSWLSNMNDFDFLLADPLFGVPFDEAIREWPKFDENPAFDGRRSVSIREIAERGTRVAIGSPVPFEYVELPMRDTRLPVEMTLAALNRQPVPVSDFPALAMAPRNDNGVTIGAFGIVIEETPPVFSWNIFNNGPGGTRYPRPNAGLAAAGLIRMWTLLDGVGAPVYLAATDTIVALDQNGQCAMEFVRVGRVWVAGQGWQDYFNLFDINKNGNWQYIDLYITVFGQTVHALLINANYIPATEYHTVTFVVEAGAVGVYAATTITVEVPDGEAIPADAIPSTVARPGFYFVEWYPSDPADVVVTEDMTFTARFNPLFHYVTFEAGDGGTLVPAAGHGLVVRIRDGFTFWPDRVPTPVANDGYEFVKWYPVNPAGFVVRETMTFTAVFAQVVPKILSITPNPAIVQRGGTVELIVITQGMPYGAWVDLNVAWRLGLSVVGGPRFYITDNKAVITVAATTDARLGRDGFSVAVRAAGQWGIPFIIDSYTFVIEVR